MRFAKKRLILRELNHVKEHLENALETKDSNGDIKLALGLVKGAIKRESAVFRKS